MFAKNRVRYSCRVVIYDLSNLPYISGRYFAKWRLAGSSQKGVTAHTTVVSHTVSWDAAFSVDAQMAVARDGDLQPCLLHFSVKQETERGSDTLGHVTVNLADCVRAVSSNCQYLLQGAKLNAMLRVQVDVTLVKGSEQLNSAFALQRLDPKPPADTTIEAKNSSATRTAVNIN